MIQWFVALFLFMTGVNSGADFKGEVNVYSHRHYDVDSQLFDQFTEETGIRVNVVKADADQLIKRLEIEGKNSPADILITVDAGRLFRAKDQGLLQPIESEVLNNAIPKYLRDPEGYWYGLTMRARVLVYAKDRVQPSQLSTYEALTDPTWKGKILVRSSQNIYNQSLLASMIAENGEAEARDWAAGIVANMARTPKGNDRDQIKAVVAGIGEVAIANSYYLGKMLTSEDPGERGVAEKVAVFFPNQNGRGAHINISGAGVTAHAKHKKAAIRFLEFLASREAQRLFAEANFEYPVREDVAECKLLQSWGDFKADSLNLSLLGRYHLEAVKIFDQVGWR